jgi:hypothetical protein
MWARGKPERSSAMSVFKSQFEMLEPFSAALLGGHTVDDVALPEGVDAAAIEAAAAALFGPAAAAELAAAGAFEPGAGFEAVAGFEPATAAAATAHVDPFAAPESWVHRGDYTDIGVGGGPDGMYVIGDGVSWSSV